MEVRFHDLPGIVVPRQVDSPVEVAQHSRAYLWAEGGLSPAARVGVLPGDRHSAGSKPELLAIDLLEGTLELAVIDRRVDRFCRLNVQPLVRLRVVVKNAEDSLLVPSQLSRSIDGRRYRRCAARVARRVVRLVLAPAAPPEGICAMNSFFTGRVSSSASSESGCDLNPTSRLLVSVSVTASGDSAAGVSSARACITPIVPTGISGGNVTRWVSDTPTLTNSVLTRTDGACMPALVPSRVHSGIAERRSGIADAPGIADGPDREMVEDFAAIAEEDHAPVRGPARDGPR